MGLVKIRTENKIKANNIPKKIIPDLINLFFAFSTNRFELCDGLPIVNAAKDEVCSFIGTVI